MKHIIIGTAGHIDHGKTSLIKMLTGFDCDTHKEEKARGITINLGFSHIDLPSSVSAGIIDVPGHKDFINTMVGGACGIDLVLLVIAADSGIMPQTIEHIHIISALGIKRGIVVLTKTDLVDEEMVEMAQYEITEYLKNTSLKKFPVIGVSAHTGKGKNELISIIDEEISKIEDDDKGSLFRMYIDRIFVVKGFGSVVTGSVNGGIIQPGQDVFLLPGIKQKLRVRSIERHGQQVDSVQKGDRAAINIIGMKAEDFERGMLLCSKQIDTTEMVDAYITMFENAPPLDIWSNITFISGTFETPARMHLLNKDLLASGDDAIVQLHLIKPGILLNKDKFIIRNSSADITLGGGQIIDATPLHHKKRTPNLIEELELLCVNTLTGNSTNEDISTVLKREFKPFTIDEIADKLNISPDDVRYQITENQANFSVYQSNGKELFISNICENTFINNIAKALEEHHHKNPIIASGLDMNELAGKLGLTGIKSGKVYLELLLEKLKNLQNIEQYQNTWIKFGHKPIIDEKTQKQINFLEKLIKDFGDEKPVYQEIELSCQSEGINKQLLRLLMTYLASKGIIRYFNNDFIHSDILQNSKIELLKALNKNNGVLNYQNFKDVLTCTKKMRILLGDILEFEKLITIVHGQDIETRIELTQKGKEYIDAHLS